MKKLIVFHMLFLNAFMLFSQQDEQVSLFHYNHMAINAGYAGNQNAICANAIVRNQWLGFGDDGGAAISTQIFNVNAPFKFFGYNHGVGLIIKNDAQVFNTNTSLNLAYAFNTEVGQGNLGVGFDLGFLNRNLLGSKFVTKDIDIIPYSDESDMIFDLGIGAFYKTDNLFLGVSAKHLNLGRADYGDPQWQQESITPHFYISGGYTYQLSNPLFEIEPSAHFKAGGPKAQVSYNARLLYNKKLWGGVSYNHGDALVTMFGMDLPSGLKFAVAYDIPLTKIGTFGTVELMLGYCFNLSVEKTTPSYKSVRFL